MEADIRQNWTTRAMTHAKHPDWKERTHVHKLSLPRVDLALIFHPKNFLLAVRRVIVKTQFSVRCNEFPVLVLRQRVDL